MSKNKTNILLVEDEEHLHHTIKLNFELEGYHVSSAYDGVQALKFIESEYFDLIVLDVMMPELDGISVVENIRLNNIETLVLILSAKNSSVDRILGLKKGADDYLTKPFNLEELLLRVEKLIQKNKRVQFSSLQVENYVFNNNSINFKALTAKNFQNKHHRLTKKEAMLLKLLIDNKGEVVNRDKILQMVWGYNVYPTTRTIDNFILNFRKYFELDPKNPKHFLSVRGIGYKFVEV